MDCKSQNTNPCDGTCSPNGFQRSVLFWVLVSDVFARGTEVVYATRKKKRPSANDVLQWRILC